MDRVFCELGTEFFLYDTLSKYGETRGTQYPK